MLEQGPDRQRAPCRCSGGLSSIRGASESDALTIGRRTVGGNRPGTIRQVSSSAATWLHEGGFTNPRISSLEHRQHLVIERRIHRPRFQSNPGSIVQLIISSRAMDNFRPDQPEAFENILNRLNALQEAMANDADSSDDQSDGMAGVMETLKGLISSQESTAGQSVHAAEIMEKMKELKALHDGMASDADTSDDQSDEMSALLDTLRGHKSSKGATADKASPMAGILQELKALQDAMENRTDSTEDHS
jgi:hypothetical protein